MDRCSKNLRRSGSEPENNIVSCGSPCLGIGASSSVALSPTSTGWAPARRAYRSVAFRTWEVGGASKLLNGSHSEYAINQESCPSTRALLEKFLATSLTVNDNGDQENGMIHNMVATISNGHLNSGHLSNGSAVSHQLDKRKCLSTEAMASHRVITSCPSTSFQSTPSASPCKLTFTACNGKAMLKSSQQNGVSPSQQNGKMTSNGNCVKSPSKAPQRHLFSPLSKRGIFSLPSSSSPSPQKSASPAINAGKRLFRYLFKTESLKSNIVDDSGSPVCGNPNGKTVQKGRRSSTLERGCDERHRASPDEIRLRNGTVLGPDGKRKRVVSFRLAKSVDDDFAPRIRCQSVKSDGCYGDTSILSGADSVDSVDDLAVIKWEPDVESHVTLDETFSPDPQPHLQRTSIASSGCESEQSRRQSSSVNVAINETFNYCSCEDLSASGQKCVSCEYKSLNTSPPKSIPFASWNAALEFIRQELEFIRRKDKLIMAELQNAMEDVHFLKSKDSPEFLLDDAEMTDVGGFRLSRSFHGGYSAAGDSLFATSPTDDSARRRSNGSLPPVPAWLLQSYFERLTPSLCRNNEPSHAPLIGL